MEDWVRGQVQELIQELLEEKVTEFLGRAKSARRSESDSGAGSWGFLVWAGQLRLLSWVLSWHGYPPFGF